MISFQNISKNNKFTCPVCNSSTIIKQSSYSGTIHPFNKKNGKLLHCMDCDLVFMDPLPTKAELDTFYTRYWDCETSVQSSSAESLIGYKAQALSRIDFLHNQGITLDNKSILDYGAGHGFFEEALNNRNVKNYKYQAIETDIAMIKSFKVKGIKVSKNLVDIAGKKFDILVAFHILEHILDPIKVINNFINYIKPGGILFIEIPNRDNSWKNNYEPHIFFFNRNSMENILKKINIKNFKIQSCGRKLDKLVKEKSIYKKIRRLIGEMLRRLGYKRIQNVSDQNRITEALARKKFEMNIYGGERQWLRIIINNK